MKNSKIQKIYLALALLILGIFPSNADWKEEVGIHDIGLHQLASFWQYFKDHEGKEFGEEDKDKLRDMANAANHALRTLTTGGMGVEAPPIPSYLWENSNSPEHYSTDYGFRKITKKENPQEILHFYASLVSKISSVMQKYIQSDNKNPSDSFVINSLISNFIARKHRPRYSMSVDDTIENMHLNVFPHYNQYYQHLGLIFSLFQKSNKILISNEPDIHLYLKDTAKFGEFYTRRFDFVKETEQYWGVLRNFRTDENTATVYAERLLQEINEKNKPIADKLPEIKKHLRTMELPDWAEKKIRGNEVLKNLQERIARLSTKREVYRVVLLAQDIFKEPGERPESPESLNEYLLDRALYKTYSELTFPNRADREEPFLRILAHLEIIGDPLATSALNKLEEIAAEDEKEMEKILRIRREITQHLYLNGPKFLQKIQDADFVLDIGNFEKKLNQFVEENKGDGLVVCMDDYGPDPFEEMINKLKSYEKQLKNSKVEATERFWANLIVKKEKTIANLHKASGFLRPYKRETITMCY